MRESVRADHDPRAELVCVSKKSSGEKRYGITKGLAHECCRATQRRRFFDTFPDPILLARQLLMTMLTVRTTE